MDAVWLNRIADAAGERYLLFLAALNNLYLQALQSPNPGSDDTRARIIACAGVMSDIFAEQEINQINADLDAVMQDAFEQTMAALGVIDAEGVSAQASENTISIADDLGKSLRVQLARDIAAVGAGLRVAALRSALSAKSRGISQRIALAQIDSSSGIGFSFQNRAGRNWPSHKSVRILWRSALVYVWNETALITLSDYAQDQVQINHPDANHEYAGQLLSLADIPSEDDLTWGDVREDIFHPNTSAYIGPVLER